MKDFIVTIKIAESSTSEDWYMSTFYVEANNLEEAVEKIEADLDI